MRKQIAAANWKMNLTLEQANELISEIFRQDISLKADQLAIWAVPFPYLLAVNEQIKNVPNCFTAAQNCYYKESGAYTGEVSAAMIASCGVEYVILGHSERREYFSEDNKMLAEKVDLCLAKGVKPIFCCGESLKTREAGDQNEFVETQLKESLFHLEPAALRGFIIAYEPIWAIGTGKTATAAQAQEMHAHIRSCFEKEYGADIAAGISILYGGSVKAGNAAEIFSKPDVDGGLVGGASLNAAEFVSIIAALKS